MKITLPLLTLTLLCASCGLPSVEKKNQEAAQSEMEKRYENWKLSLNDSVDSLMNLYNAQVGEIDSLRASLDEANALYQVISDPVLVEKYRVAKGWGSFDTTQSPGILGRILEDETVEIIVSRRGAAFTSITLSAGGETVSSKSVPQGDALNTSVNGLARVAFNDALNLADFVRRHISDNVVLTYSSGGTLTLNQQQKQMLADISRLPSALSRLRELESKSTVIYNKANLYRSKTEEMANSSK